MKKNNVFAETVKRTENKADMLLSESLQRYNTVVFDFPVGQVAEKSKSYPFVFRSANGEAAVIDAAVCLSNYSDSFSLKVEVNGAAAEKNCNVTIAGIVRLCFKAHNVVRGPNVCVLTLDAEQEVPYWTDSCAVTVSGRGVADKTVCAAALTESVLYFAENGRITRTEEGVSTEVCTFASGADCIAAAVTDGQEVCFVLSGGRLYALSEKGKKEIASSVQWFSAVVYGGSVTVYAVIRGMLFSGVYRQGAAVMSPLPLLPYSRIKRVAACCDDAGNTALFAETGGGTVLFKTENGVFTEKAKIPVTGICGSSLYDGKAMLTAVQKGVAVCAEVAQDCSVFTQAIGRADAAAAGGSGKFITLSGGSVTVVTPRFDLPVVK